MSVLYGSAFQATGKHSLRACPASIIQSSLAPLPQLLALPELCRALCDISINFEKLFSSSAIFLAFAKGAGEDPLGKNGGRGGRLSASGAPQGSRLPWPPAGDLGPAGWSLLPLEISASPLGLHLSCCFQG